jgi:FkbM family methyltransferase
MSPLSPYGHLGAARPFRRAAGSAFERALRLLPRRARGPVARRLLRAFPPSQRLSLAGRAIPTLCTGDHLPIVAGPLEGAWWVADSGLHACVEGSYESENQRLFLEHVRPGSVVFDIGANAGFFTLLASRLAGSDGLVVAFEPFPAALAHLRRHLELNGVENVRVVAAAVSDAPGSARFHAHAQITMGRLDDAGELAVDVVRLDDLCTDGTLPVPDVLKVDVEGAELQVLRGAETILRTRRPTILLATHGSESDRACRALLERHGYRLEPLPYDTTAPEFDYLGELAAVPG